MGKCKIENCENYCDKSSEYICDICYEGYLAGRLSFREYIKIRKHREFDYPVERKAEKKKFNKAEKKEFNKIEKKEFNEQAESMPGLWTLFSYILFAVVLFYTMFIIIGGVSDWIFYDSGAWYQSKPIQSFLNLDILNIDRWKVLAIICIRLIQIIVLIAFIGAGIGSIIEGHVLAGVILIIAVLYISLIGHIYANEIIEYLIYGN